MRKRKPLAYYLPSAIALFLAFALFRLLPLEVASALGGWIGRTVGPRLKWHRIACRNFELIMPDMASARQQHILSDMWDNLGRTLAEYPWLGHKQLNKRITLSTEAAHLLKTLSEPPRAVIFAAGHLANWEVAPFAAYLHNIPLTLIYRHINNPLVDRMIYNIRRRYCHGLYPKGKRGAAEVLRALKKGKSLGLLVDQKMNDGLELSFLGRPAMTAAATAELALRFEVPVIGVRIIREPKVHFRIELCEIQPPLQPLSRDEAIREFMQLINQQLERWILEHPAQWLWVHQRWGKL